MELTSAAFEENTPIPEKYTCEGENVRPPLRISHVPKGTRSLALVVSDPDAPTPDFTHWLAWNILPEVVSLEEGVLPHEAVEGTNDFGNIGWGGPCPPSGTHRYEFHLYALDSLVDLPETSNKTDLQSHIGGFILEEAILVGLYSKQRT